MTDATDVRTRPRPASGRAEGAGARGRPAIDPRFAQRWIEARRQEGRKRLRVLIGAGVAVAVVAAGVGALYSPLFELRHLRVTEQAGRDASVSTGSPASAGSTAPGAPGPGALAALAGLNGHPLLIDINAGSVARRLDANPWLGAAHVTRHWPATVGVSVTTRQPIAVVPIGPAGQPTGYAEVDETGRVLADIGTLPLGLTLLHWSGPLPRPGSWLAGTAGPGVPPGASPSALADLAAGSDAVDVPSGPAAALAVLAALPGSLRSTVLSITSRPELSLVIAPPNMDGGSVDFQFGDGSALQAKVTALVTMVDQADLTGVSSVDLTVPNRPEATTDGSGT